MKVFADALLDALKDTAIVLPIMYLAYLLVCFFSHSNSKKYSKILHKTKKAGPLVGAFLGCIPQCGFSSVMAQLYSNKIVTIGTLFAVFLATSDEAIPLMVTDSKYIPKLLILLGIKIVFAIIVGYLIDIFTKLCLNYKKNKTVNVAQGNNCAKKTRVQCENIKEDVSLVQDKDGHHHEELCDACDHKHDHCEHHHEYDEDEQFISCGCNHKHVHSDCCAKDIFLDALRHTLIIIAYVFGATLVINLLVGYCGLDAIRGIFTNNLYLQILIASLVGLIPNCAASVLLVELYMSGVIMFAPLVAGLCAGAGVGLIVLWTANRKHVWQNLFITLSLVALAYLCGIITSFMPI